MKVLENLKKYPHIFPWLSDVLILPQFRGKGYGKKLLEIGQQTLKKLGYKVLETNYRCPFGEADIIVKTKSEEIVFVEDVSIVILSYAPSFEFLVKVVVIPLHLIVAEFVLYLATIITTLVTSLGTVNLKLPAFEDVPIFKQELPLASLAPV